MTLESTIDKNGIPKERQKTTKYGADSVKYCFIQMFN
jgi:hypothetical protein